MRHSLAAVAVFALPIPDAVPAPWNDSGHRIVSLLAWEGLHEPTRRAVAELLVTHPRYEADLLVGLPAGADTMARARHAFAAASNWPDTVRSPTHPMHRVANQPRWHYVDVPFVRDEVVPSPRTDPGGKGPQDLVEAITKNVADLRNRDLVPAERAIALCWVVHLIEDLHQPLHACTLYSSQFPEGDKGGNAFFVTRSAWDPDSRTNLHAIWDALLGDYHVQAWDACVATGLAARPDLARQRFQADLAVLDPARWVQESHEVGIAHVYLRGELRGAAAGTADAGRPPLLPPGYLANAELVAMRRAALAAHRLADVLNESFGSK